MLPKGHSKADMRGKRKSNSVNRTEHEPYASYPLPQHTTHLERNVYSGFSTVFLSLLLLVAGVGFPAARFWR